LIDRDKSPLRPYYPISLISIYSSIMGKNKRKQQSTEEDPEEEVEEEPEEEEDVAEDSDDDDEDGDRPSKKTRSSSNVIASEEMPTVTLDSQVGPKSSSKQQPIILLLDQATLETVKNKRGVFELLNCDDHREICKRKLHKDPNVYRPDILHQELLALQDSPLNKAGLLKIYVATQKNVLIDLHPATRIPRTYKRFAGLMVQLLHKMKIKAGQDHTTLLKVIKNPFSQYLPAGTRCFGMSCQGTLYSPLSLATSLVPADYTTAPPTCFVVGAMSTGHVQLEDHPYMEKMISVSEYPLSGAAALSRIMAGIEHHWGIV